MIEKAEGLVMSSSALFFAYLDRNSCQARHKFLHTFALTLQFQEFGKLPNHDTCRNADIE